MPEQLRIRVGSKTHTGALNSENNDRILIGMDPAANDWLYSPDEILTGEFGSLVLLADGLSGNKNAGKSAGMICRIIRKLFDETLELPPDDENLLFLLKKFLKIAHRHLILYAEENIEFRKCGASVTMVLIKDFKAYVVWSGHTRMYRYSPGGVNGSIHCSLPSLETLTIDHSTKTLRKVFPESFSGQDTLFDDLLSYLGNPHHEPEVSGRIVPIQLGDKLLLSTDGVYSYIPSEDLASAIGHTVHPELICEDIITQAFNANSKENISVVAIEVMNGEPSAAVLPLGALAQYDMAKEILMPLKEHFQSNAGKYNAEIQEEVIPEIKEDSDKDHTQLEPMKVRTVMPEIKTTDFTEIEKSGVTDFQEKAIQENQESLDDLKEESDDIDIRENEQVELPPVSSPEPPEFTNFHSKSKPRISKTAYPDPDDYPTSKKTVMISLEDIMYFNENQFILSYQIPFIVFNFIKQTPYNFDRIVPFVRHGHKTASNIPVYENEKEIEEEFIKESTGNDTEASEETDQIETGDDLSEVDQSLSLIEESDEEISQVEEKESDIEEEEIQTETIEDQSEDSHFQSVQDEDPPEPFFNELDTEQESEDTEIIEEEIKEEKGGFVYAEKSESPETETIDPLPQTSGKKKLMYWRVGIVLAALLLIPVLICREKNKVSPGDMSFFPGETKDVREKSEVDIAAPPVKKEEEEVPQKESVQPSVPTERTPEIPKDQTEKKAEDKKKSIEPEPEPQYDNRIRENKHQLIDEIETMMRRKDQLCRQIDTYKKNAPSKKTPRIEALQQDCDQLGKKFSSIYDSRTGYFKTVRYDFLDGTIKNIRFSMEQLEEKFTTVRNEE